MGSSIFKHKLSFVLLGLYILLLLWWIKIFITGVRESDENYLFGFAYATIALIGGINGLVISKKWGGFKSLMGRGIIFFSLGLLGLWFGQTIWSYYNLIARVEVPYPSIADIGFFSIIPLYFLGVLSFAKAAGAKLSLRTMGGKAVVVLLPLIIMVLAYIIFLRNISPDFSMPLKTFLDFGYPLGEAIIVSLALTTYFLSNRILGGKMRGRILYLIFAIVFHMVTEYLFIYQAADGSYYNAGPVDLMYMASFTIMALGLLSFKDIE